jgi:glucose-6-phosphate 1-epimerase
MWSVATESGKGGLPTVNLRCLSGESIVHSAEIYLFGGTLASWVHNGEEKVFMSPDAVFNGVKALRGGVPLVFPQFGQPLPSMPQHGFARNSTWQVASTCGEADSARAVLTLSHSEATLAVWPHRFVLTYTVVLSPNSLRSDLQINCLDDTPFTCQALLHSYLRVDDIRTLSVSGFQGLSYVDKTRDAGTFEEADPRHTIAHETDSVYIEGTAGRIPDIELFTANESRLRVSKGAYMTAAAGTDKLATDCVLWNPWVEKAKALADMSDDGFEHFVCVEPGLVHGWTEVSKDSTLVLFQELFPTNKA